MRLSSSSVSDPSAKCLDFISPITHVIFLWLWERHIFESSFELRKLAVRVIVKFHGSLLIPA